MPTLGMFVIMALALAACETMNTIGQRLSSIEFPSFGGFSSGDSGQRLAGNCPPVQVVPELAALSEFSPMAKATPQNLVSKVTLSEIAATCNEIRNGSLGVDIVMTLDGEVGPRARLTPDERPTFAYPYFVALTTVDGEIVAKEIHAASMNYGKGQNAQSVREERSHDFVLKTSTSPADYRILVGFQLTDDQLAYNRANPLKETPSVLVASEDSAARNAAAIAPAAGSGRSAPLPLRKPERDAAKTSGLAP